MSPSWFRESQMKRRLESQAVRLPEVFAVLVPDPTIIPHYPHFKWTQVYGSSNELFKIVLKMNVSCPKTCFEAKTCTETTIGLHFFFLQNKV